MNPRSARGKIPIAIGPGLGAAAIVATLLATPGATSGKYTVGGIVREHAKDLAPYPRVAAIVKRALENKELTPKEAKVFDALFEKNAGHLFPKAAQRVLVEGEATAEITVKLTDAQGREVAKKTEGGVPVKLWNRGSPQHRGKTKSNRRRGAD